MIGQDYELRIDESVLDLSFGAIVEISDPEGLNFSLSTTVGHDYED